MEVINGNVFDSFLYPNTLVVHGCNAQGVMGSGVAKVVKEQFNTAFIDYLNEYNKRNSLDVGQVIFSEVLDKRFVANAITQQFYGKEPGRIYVDYEALSTCFYIVAEFARSNGIETIHYPKIGAGLGGGDWNIISRIIDSRLSGLNHFLWDPES